jgi:hypothetical protein
MHLRTTMSAPHVKNSLLTLSVGHEIMTGSTRLSSRRICELDPILEQIMAALYLIEHE